MKYKSTFSRNNVNSYVELKMKAMANSHNQDRLIDKQTLPPIEKRNAHYRVSGSSFWRGFFLGFFPSIYGEHDSQVRRDVVTDPFLEDQKRIGADMFNALGIIAEDARESEEASN